MGLISETIDRTVNILVDAMTSFSNENGPDNGNALGILYAEYGLSDPPTKAEFDGLSIKSKVLYRAAEKQIEDRAIAMNDLFENILAIDSGTGPFNTAEAVKIWVTENMGLVGVDIVSNIDAFLALRPKFVPLISSAEMKNHADSVRGFTIELDAQRQAGNVKV